MAEHPNVSVVHRLYQAFIARDVATLWQLMGDDVVLHVPGRSVFAGSHRGKERILSVFYESGKLAARSFRLETHAVFGERDHVVGLHHITGVRGERIIDQDSFLVCHVDDGVLVDVWVGLADLRQFDEFWA